MVAFISMVVVMSIFALKQLKQSSLQQVGHSLESILAMVQEAQNIWIDQRRSDIREFATRPEFVELVEELTRMHEQNQTILGSKPLNNMREMLKNYLKQKGDKGFFVINSDFISIASNRNVNLGLVNIIQTKRPNLLAGGFQGETVLVPPMISDVPLRNKQGILQIQPPTMFIISPVRSKQGHIIAVLAFRLDPTTHFTRLTQLGQIGESGETYAFDKRALMITDSRFDQQLKDVDLIRRDQLSILNIKITDPGGNMVDGFRPQESAYPLPLTTMAKAAISGRNGVNTSGYRDYRGVLVYGAWAWDKNNQYGLVTEIDAIEALQPYIEMRNVLITVVILVSGMGFAMWGVVQKVKKSSSRQLKQAYAELEERVKERTSALQETQVSLSKANTELQQLATTDGLTGLHNRRYFDNFLANEWQRCLREEKSIAILIFDIDFFKSFNDCYGHQAGDECLIRISQLLKGLPVANRPSDCIARYGGEEFVICLSNTDEEYAQTTADKVCSEIENLQIEHKTSGVDALKVVTASIGMSIRKCDRNHTAKELLFEADKALYLAKRNGRNQVWIHGVSYSKVGEVIQLKQKLDNK